MSRREVVAYAITHAPRGQKGGPYEGYGVGESTATLALAQRYVTASDAHEDASWLSRTGHTARVIRIVRARPSEGQEASAVEVLRELVAAHEAYDARDDIDDYEGLDALIPRARTVLAASGPDPMRVVRAAARNALTAAGIPDAEPYPAEAVDAREASLRTGGRSLHTPERIARLAAERDEARRLHSAAEAQVACRNELRARLAQVERERDEARAEFARIAHALGTVHEADGHAPYPGTAAEMISEIQARGAEMQRLAAELARLTAPADGEPSYEALREAFGEFPGGGLEFALSQWRAGVAHERATHARSTDAVYRERDILAALAAKLAQRLGYPAWTAEHDLAADPTWEPEWRDIVFFRLPTGQCSWHLKVGEKAECGLNSLPVAVEPWDGHTTEEKYARILAFLSTAEARPETKGRATDEELSAIALAAYDAEPTPHVPWLSRVALAVAARVRREPGLAEQLVALPGLTSLVVWRETPLRTADRFGVQVNSRKAIGQLPAEVPATLARLAGLDVSRG